MAGANWMAETQGIQWQVVERLHVSVMPRECISAGHMAGIAAGAFIVVRLRASV